MEVWKKIPIAPCYEASSLGRVRNVGTGRVMTAHLRKDGYRHVGLREGQPKRLWRKVSQLVGAAFLGPAPFPKAVVAHKDGSRDNDAASNLYWATHKQNHADREAHGRAPKGSRNGASVLTETDVLEVRKALAAGTSQSAIADAFGVCPATISHINTRKNWRHI